MQPRKMILSIVLALAVGVALRARPVFAIDACNVTSGIPGALEIDGPSGNVTLQDTNGVNHCEDWRSVFGGGNASFICNDGTKLNTSTATAASCINETTRSVSIFTGGGSKDQKDLSQWAGKSGGGLPDKDNLVHGFAARYTANGQRILYFGGDRFATSGDAQIGFWFFQNPVSFDSATGKFSGLHRAGDLLFLTNFTGGGTQSNIQAFRVDSCDASGNCVVTSIAGGSATGSHFCNTQDTLCASTDCPIQPTGKVRTCSGTTDALDPNFQDKSGTPLGQYGPTAFFEGGMDLDAFGLGGECFSSFLLETRSSQSITAVLKDFLLQEFQPCTARPETQVHDSAHANITGTTVPVGTVVHDKVMITGESGVDAPTGTVSFAFFNNSDCSGTPVTAQACEQNVAISEGTVQDPPVSEADNSTCTRTPGVGDHAYQATYSGDGNYLCTGTSCVAECEPFTVIPVASHITTRILNATTNLPITNTLVDATSVVVQDEALVTCDSGTTPQGKVTFTRYSNGDCTGTPITDACGHCSTTTTQGCTADSDCPDQETCVAGNGCSITNGIAKSTAFELQASALSFQANYSGDPSCVASSTSNCEPVCVIKKCTLNSDGSGRCVETEPPQQ